MRTEKIEPCNLSIVRPLMLNFRLGNKYTIKHVDVIIAVTP